MKSYSYFPGCSSSDGSGRCYGTSTEAVASILGLELKEINEWNCCGATPFASVNELGSLCGAARNLSIAEREGKGLDLVTPCSACYVILARANELMAEHPETGKKIDIALAAGGIKYNRSVNVRHLLDVLYTDVGTSAIASKVKMKLKGLKVASYYGCQVVRPDMGFDDPEMPVSMDRIVESLGAEATPFPLKSRCCGGSQIISEQKITLGLVRKLLENAADGGAQAVVTVCPLCQMNLDMFQGMVNSEFGASFDLPVLFLPQLMGIAMGVGRKTLGLDKLLVSPDKVLGSFVAV